MEYLRVKGITSRPHEPSLSEGSRESSPVPVLEFPNVGEVWKEGKMWESATRGWNREDVVPLGHCFSSVQSLSRVRLSATP